MIYREEVVAEAWKMYKMLKNKEADEEEMRIFFDTARDIQSYFALRNHSHALDLIRNTTMHVC